MTGARDRNWFDPEALDAVVPHAERLIAAVRDQSTFQHTFMDVLATDRTILLSCLMQWAALPGSCGYRGRTLAHTFTGMIGPESPWLPRIIELIDAGAAVDAGRTARAVLDIHAAMKTPEDANGFYCITYLMATFAGRTTATGGGAQLIGSTEDFLKRAIGDAPETWPVRGPATMIICALVNGREPEAREMFGRLLDNHGDHLATGVLPLLAGALAGLGTPTGLVSLDEHGIPDSAVNPAASGVSGPVGDPALHAGLLAVELVKAVRSGAEDWLTLVAAEVADVPAETKILLLWQMFTSTAARLAQFRLEPPERP